MKQETCQNRLPIRQNILASTACQNRQNARILALAAVKLVASGFNSGAFWQVNVQHMVSKAVETGSDGRKQTVNPDPPGRREQAGLEVDQGERMETAKQNPGPAPLRLMDAPTASAGADALAVAQQSKPGVLDALALLPDKALLTSEALALAIGVDRRTIRRMVQRFELPPGVMFGRSKCWQAGAVLRWFEGRAERAQRQVQRLADKA